MKLIRLGLLLTAMAFVFGSCSDDDDNGYMNLSQKSTDISAAGGELTLVVNSNVKYVVNHDCDWINIHSTENEGDATTFGITVLPNSVTEERTGRIKFIGEGVTPKAFDIRQLAFVPTGVSVTSIEAEFDETTAEFDVLGEDAWTATSSNPAYVLTPSSGTGTSHVTVTFPVNPTPDDINVVITVTMGGKDYNVSLAHKGMRLTGVIAEWPIEKLRETAEATWGTRELENKAGFIDASLAPMTGTGSVTFYSCDKSAYPIDSKGYACYIQTGAHGDIIFKATIKGDYWLVKGGLESGAQIPAGRKIKFEFTASITKHCCPYWIVEYLDGTEWRPAIPTKTANLSATQSLLGNTVNYSETVTYNYQFAAASTYTLVSGEFTMDNAAPDVQLRMRPVGEIGLEGAFIDQLTSNCSSRFSAQHPHVDGKAVKEYNQTIKIEFAD